ncbi:MAG: hypothetical protein J0L93_09335 [Deltaproteobacteria bacterium]|nr:hypothetical protein [Deltaproteobacteria bacterium]
MSSLTILFGSTISSFATPISESELIDKLKDKAFCTSERFNRSNFGQDFVYVLRCDGSDVIDPENGIEDITALGRIMTQQGFKLEGTATYTATYRFDRYTFVKYGSRY